MYLALKTAKRNKYPMGRRLGQHFLVDDHWAQTMATLSGANAEALVLEIGPGHGALTQVLLARRATVCAVELDAVLVAKLKARWADEKRLTVLHDNALTCQVDPETLFETKKPYIIAANLPYYLTTPFLFKVLRARQHVVHIALMLQREVAARICATVASKKSYGALSIAMQYAFETKLHYQVPPQAFKPPPKVHSAILTLTPKSACFNPLKEEAFLHHVKQLFMRRRKRLLSVLRSFYPQVFQSPSPQAQAIAQLVGERRAEALEVAEHKALFELLFTPLKGEIT